MSLLSFILCPVKRKLHMGQSQRPGEEDQVEEPEQARTDLSFAEDVLPTTLHVRNTHCVLCIIVGPFPLCIDYGITYKSTSQTRLFVLFCFVFFFSIQLHNRGLVVRESNEKNVLVEPWLHTFGCSLGSTKLLTSSTIYNILFMSVVQQLNANARRRE